MTHSDTSTGKQTPTDTIRTIREALRQSKDICAEWERSASEPWAMLCRETRLKIIEARDMLSALEASLKAEEPGGISVITRLEDNLRNTPDNHPCRKEWQTALRVIKQYLTTSDDCTYCLNTRHIQIDDDSAKPCPKCRAIKPMSANAEEASEIPYNWPRGCKWPDGKKFTFANDAGEHDPCYVIMPDGAMLSLNHYNDAETDICRAEFIIAACNYYLRTTKPTSANAEQLPPAGDVVERAFNQFWNMWYGKYSGNMPVDAVAVLIGDCKRAAMKDYGDAADRKDGHCTEEGSQTDSVKGVTSPPAPTTYHGTHGDSVEVSAKENELKEVVTRAILRAEPLDFIIAGGTINQIGEKYIKYYKALEMCWAAVKAAVDYLRPAPVSLEKGISAIDAVSKEDGFSRTIVYDAGAFAKACAEAWGLKYV